MNTTSGDRGPPASAPPNRPRAGDVVEWLVLWVLYSLYYAWTILFCGLAAAFFGGFLGRTVQQWAWVVGALVAAVGVPLGMDKSSAFRRPPWRPTASNYEPARRTAERGRHDRLVWDTREGLFWALIALVFGGCLGAALAMSWFSITMSPFAPASWVASVSYRAPEAPDLMSHQREGDSGGYTTKHPLPFILLLAPPAVLVPVAFVLGGLQSVTE